MRNFKKLLKFFPNNSWHLWQSRFASVTLIIFFIALPYQISKGCGPFELEFEGYSFLNPNIVNTKAEYARYGLAPCDQVTVLSQIIAAPKPLTPKK